MEFLTDYGLFLAKVLTLVLIPILAVVMTLLFVQRLREAHDGHLDVKFVNDKFETMGLVLEAATLPKQAFKKSLKELKQRRKQYEKARAKPGAEPRKRVFVIGFKGDIRASAVSSLREEITAILTVAAPQDEVFVRLESAGGVVHSYGLAASQLRRIRDRSINLTVAVDRIAASGGYMMACVADRIIAAPFAVVGSIGVIGQMPNFNRLLKEHHIDFEQHTAGEYKRTLTVLGENTDKDRQKFKMDLEDIHSLFKQFVSENRKQLDIDKVATGEYWYGRRAVALNLIDALQTSDDYLKQASETADVFEVRFVRKRPRAEKLIHSTLNAIAQRARIRQDFPADWHY